MKSLTRLLIILLFSTPLLAQETFQAGKDFALIEPAQATSGNKVEVVEVFSYMCPHCNTFEPFIDNWKKNMPEQASFEAMPATFNRGSWEVAGRLHYTADVLGLLDKVHGDIFSRIHNKREYFRSVDDVVSFLANYGADEAMVRKTFTSFAVETKLRRAQNLIPKYGVTGVPTIIVNGKYRIDGKMAGNYGRMIEIINFLVAKEAGDS